MAITLTIDLEDPTEQYRPDGRYVRMTDHLLDFCAELNCRATFFVVGKLARANPQLIAKISRAGHEVAYHSHDHRSLTEDTPDRFRRLCREDKAYLEDLAQASLLGFRAPRFSLTRESDWVLKILADEGFLYSSSVMSTPASLFGYPAAPSTAFRWTNGLTEFPVPLTQFGPFKIPYLGGIYLYSMPSWLTKRFMDSVGSHEVLWTYTHPYDLDREQRFERMAHTPLWISFVLWLARRAAAGKLRNVLTAGMAPRLCDRLEETELPLFEALGKSNG